MPTFLHIADIHLDSAFSAHFDARRAKLRRSEVRRCLSGILDRAKEVDVLLIAGDLFDGKNVSAETLSFLKRKFAELTGTRVFIAAGNHDPYTAESVYAKEDFGDNVHVFGTEPECVEIPELKIRVHGVSFKGQFQDETLVPLNIEKKEDFSDIILLHADLTSIGGESRYNPIDKEFIERCGADYLALGHIHKRSEVQRIGKTYYAYPGTIEGHGFDECGDMGCYIGKIEDGVVDVAFEKTCIRRMLCVDVDLSGVSDNLGAAELIKAELAKAGTADDMYKLVLGGRVKPGFLNPDIIREEVEASVHYLEIRDETRPDYDVDEIAAQNTLCGEFVRIMKRKSAEDAELSEEAIILGLEALLGGDV